MLRRSIAGLSATLWLLEKDNCQDFGGYSCLEKKYEIIISDDMREFINQRKPTTPENYISRKQDQKEAKAIRDYVY